jgi:nucleoside triphosphate pyrophosphatase
MSKLVLASASPRRRELLAALCRDFRIEPSALEEILPEHVPLPQAVEQLAVEKAEAVASRFPGATIIGADTIVALDRRALGKPETANQARLYLQWLRGRRHEVITGVCVIRGDRRVSRSVRTPVELRPYSDREIERSIEAGTPFDKAGAYAIQDTDFQPVAEIDGCYCNVMGLPLWTLLCMLREAGAGEGLCEPDVSRLICAVCPCRLPGP